MRAGLRHRLAAGAAILLIAPLLVDHVLWTLWRQQLQQSVDGAAIGAAVAVDRGEAPRASVDRRRAGVPLAAPAQVEVPPRDGRYANLPGAVRVSVTASRSPPFQGLLFGPSPMRARAAAARIAYRGGGSAIVRVE